MSHFTVGVILENPKGDSEKLQRDLKNALAPFQENNMGDCPKAYLKFHSVTEEERYTYENGTIEKLVCQDGTILDYYDERFKVILDKENWERDTNEHKYTSGVGGKIEYISFDYSSVNGQLKDVPYKNLYPTFEQYMKEYGEHELDEEMKDYGYWENPNAKWDWWQVGGRWIDNILVKGEDYIKVKRSFFDLSKDKKSPDGYTWASGGIIKDIDFNKTMEGEYEKAIRFWELIVEEQPLKDGEEKPFNMFKKDYYIERYGTKEKYAEYYSTYFTYALLVDGNWISKGEMGWFGIDDSTKDSEEVYIEKFKEIMSFEENQDKMFVVVDCHI